MGAATGALASAGNGLLQSGSALFKGIPNKMGGVVGGSFAGGADPESANIETPIGEKDVTQSLAANQNALAQQQSLLDALQRQGGLTNQSNVFDQTQGLANQLSHANGLGAQQQAIAALQGLSGQQQSLAGQYQNIAAGQGANPAQAMLNNATGQNIASQAALMASQRGAGANVGLMARQAAQQGGALQQQAVGQGAQLQAQQQLAALQGLGQQQQAIGGTQQAIAGIGGQQLGAQQAQQQALAAQSSQQVGQQMGATTTLNQAQQANQQALLNAMNQQNQNKVTMQGNINSANANLKSTGMQGTQGLIGGVLNGAGAALGMAKGGEVSLADGGAVAPVAPMAVAPTEPIVGPQSSFGKFLAGWGNGTPTSNSGMAFNMAPANSGAAQVQQGATNFGQGLGKMMNRPKSVEPGQTMAGPDAAAMPMDTMVAAKGGLAKDGGHVAAKGPEQKAVKKGDSYANDKVPAILSEGEVVIPRSVMQSKDPAKGAADFVARVMAKRGKK